MKNFLILVFLFGLFAVGCSSPPAKVIPSGAQNCYVQVADVQLQVPVISAVDETALPTSDTPAPIKWVDENFWSTVSGILLLAYEFLALKMPTSKSISILGNLYKLLTWFVPDKSNKGGQFSIRDKL
jgi:hypothetical protein